MNSALKKLAGETILIGIAKALNYEHVGMVNGEAHYHCHCRNPQRFDPQNNPAQKDEIIDKFKINTEYNHKTNEWDAWINPAAEYWHSESRTEAVLAAAEEFVK